LKRPPHGLSQERLVLVTDFIQVQDEANFLGYSRKNRPAD